MKRYLFLAVQAVWVSAGLSAAGAAENWPGWRGLRGDGTVEARSSLPVIINGDHDGGFYLRGDKHLYCIGRK